MVGFSSLIPSIAWKGYESWQDSLSSTTLNSKAAILRLNKLGCPRLGDNLFLGGNDASWLPPPKFNSKIAPEKWWLEEKLTSLACIFFRGELLNFGAGIIFQLGWNDQKQAKKKTVSPEVFHAKNRQTAKEDAHRARWLAESRSTWPFTTHRRRHFYLSDLTIWKNAWKKWRPHRILVYISEVSHKLWKRHRKYFMVLQYTLHVYFTTHDIL